MPQLTGKTNIVGGFGGPVGPSLSPARHSAAFVALAMNWLYPAFEVRQLGAANAIQITGGKLAKPLKSHFPQSATFSRDLTDPGLELDLTEAGRFVNATSVGMYPNEEVAFPIPPSGCPPVWR